MKETRDNIAGSKKDPQEITRENQKKYHLEVDLLPDSTNGEAMWKRINELMMSNGDSLVNLSRRLGYEDSSSLSRLRKKNAVFSTVNIVKLAKHYNVSTDYLLGLTEINNPKYMEESDYLEETFNCLIPVMLKFLPEDRRQAFMVKLMQKNT